MTPPQSLVLEQNFALAPGGAASARLAKTGWVAGPRVLVVAGFFGYLALLALAALGVARWLPDQLALHVGGHALQIHDIHQKIFSNAGLLLLILPSVLWLEWAFTGWQSSSCRRLLMLAPSARTDLACLFLDQSHLMGQIGRLMMLGLSLISGAGIAAWLKTRTGFAVDMAFLPLALQVLVYFYVYTFFDYWAHRIGHTRWFWPLHRYHHAAEDFTVVNAERIHPAGFVGIFLINLPMVVLGAGAEAMIWVNALTIVLGYVIHSNIEADFGWIGRYVIQSPLHHRLHHKLDMSTPTGFFGMAPIWDHLFGGWSECRDKGVAIGVDTPYRHGFWVLPDLLRDYYDFFKGLLGRRHFSPSERI